MKKLVIVFFVLALMVFMQTSLAKAYSCEPNLKAAVCTTSYTDVTTIGTRPNRIEVSSQFPSKPYVLFVDGKKVDSGVCKGAINDLSMLVGESTCDSSRYAVTITDEHGAQLFENSTGQIFSFRNCVNLACVNSADFK